MPFFITGRPLYKRMHRFFGFGFTDKKVSRTDAQVFFASALSKMILKGLTRYFFLNGTLVFGTANVA